MANELIINANLPETRIAMVQDGEIQELLIERDSEVGIVGNIYKGKVLRVLPGMQAAFVDIGQDKAAFLYVDDVYFPNMDHALKTNPIPENISISAEDAQETQISSDNRESSSESRTESRRENSNLGMSSNNRQQGRFGKRDRNNRKNQQKGRHGKNNRNQGKMNTRSGGQEMRRNLNAHQRPQFMTGALPGSPEEYAYQQSQFGRQMLDISEEDYLAEMEAKRAVKKNDADTLGAASSEDVDDAIGNHIEGTDEEIGEENTDDSDGEVIQENESIEPEVEAFASKAEPQAEDDAPTARSFVAEEAAIEAIEEDFEDDDEGDVSGIYRSEPVIDADAWAAEVDDAADAVSVSEPAVESQATEDAAVVSAPEMQATTESQANGETQPETKAPITKIALLDTPVKGRPQQQQQQKQRFSKKTRSDDDEDFMPHRRRREPVKIEDLVKEGQELIVQVAKDPIATKGARLTCHVSLPGRYLVFMPSVDHVGVSRRIESDFERRRLKEIISAIRPEKTGVIVRTASGKQTDEKLKEDLDYIVQAWNEIQKKFKKQKAPSVVYQDLNIVLRSIRDIVSDDIDRIVVDSDREFKNISKFVSRFMPSMKAKLNHYQGDMPIFDYYGIEPEIERALERRVWLKSGGYIVIDQAEALVAIDVNTGRFVGKRNLEDTILKTNLEAVKEIAYQMRLRNCGGIIIMDLIDMEKDAHKEKVYKALEEELKKDRARPTIMRISQLGLVEMTRKRTRDTIVRSLCQPCAHCKGRGFVKNPLTISYDVLRDIEREGHDKDTTAVTIQCHPEVADVLQGDKRDVVESLEHQFGKKISVRANGAYPLEHFEIVAHRGDSKSETLTSDERRQRLRQKLNSHLQKLTLEQRKESSKNTSDARSSSQENEMNADSSGKEESSEQSSSERHGKFHGKKGRHHKHKRSHRHNKGEFSQEKKTNQHASTGEGDESPAKLEGTQSEEASFEANQAEAYLGNDEAAMSGEDLGNDSQQTANAEGQGEEGNSEPRQRRHQGPRDRNRRNNRNNNRRGGRDHRRGGGVGSRSAGANAGGNSAQNAAPRMTRWDYIRQKYEKPQEGGSTETTKESSSTTRSSSRNEE